MQRREFLRLAGLAAGLGLAAGCGMHAGNPSGTAALPANGTRPGSPNADADNFTRAEKPFASKNKAGVPGPCPHPVEAISRASWKADPPIANRLNAMGYVSRVTVHHEGNPGGNWDTSFSTVARSLRQIQSEHRARMRAADIGYHYVIDRTGRVWEGRSHLYQGAHVREANPHNLGVMVMGNFDLQQPTEKQLESLQSLCHMLLHGYDLTPSALNGHCDLASTRCPGKNLEPYVRRLRSKLIYA